MGNKMGKTSKKYAKVMKINGEVLKLKTPAKVSDVIKDYPGHVVLDSKEFLRFNLRANPLEPDIELRPKNMYLLVQLPNKPLGRSVTWNTRGGERVKFVQRSVSDVIGTTRSMDDKSSGQMSLRQVKMRLPKTVVERIMVESSDESDMAHKIFRLYAEDPTAMSISVDGRDKLDTVVEGDDKAIEKRENDDIQGHCFKVVHSPHHHRYKRLGSSIV